jgi:uncharacterized damage-inducible protein DinB
MNLIDPIREEFARERAITRRVLEALPGDKFDWRPHEKSFTLGRLAAHLAEIPGWGGVIFGGDLFELNMKEWKPAVHATVADLLAEFDRNADAFAAALPAVTDAQLSGRWRMTVDGNPAVEGPRLEVIRTWVLNHTVHHRAQLTVYLRLLGAPVPGVYGPSADEQQPG